MTSDHPFLDVPCCHVAHIELSQVIDIHDQSGQVHLEHLSDTIIVGELTSVSVLKMMKGMRMYGTVQKISEQVLSFNEFSIRGDIRRTKRVGLGKVAVDYNDDKGG